LVEEKGIIKDSNNDSVKAATMGFGDSTRIIPEKTCSAQGIEDNSSLSADESLGGSTCPEPWRLQQPDRLAASRMVQ
jgi:hypothetical protein